MPFGNNCMSNRQKIAQAIASTKLIVTFVSACAITATMCAYCPAPYNLLHEAVMSDHTWVTPTEGEGNNSL